MVEEDIQNQIIGGGIWKIEFLGMGFVFGVVLGEIKFPSYGAPRKNDFIGTCTGTNKK